MSRIKAYALAKWKSSDIIDIIASDGELALHEDLSDILLVLKKKAISQFQIIDSLPSKKGRWYYLPYDKDILQFVLASSECNQSNIEMLIVTVNQKILERSVYMNDNQRESVLKLMAYFDKQYNKDPKQIKQIMQTFDNTKQTVQESIEKLINNKDQLSNIEIKSLDLEDSSKVFYDTAQAAHRKHRLNRLKKKLLIGTLITLSIGFIIYWLFY